MEGLPVLRLPDWDPKSRTSSEASLCLGRFQNSARGIIITLPLDRYEQSQLYSELVVSSPFVLTPLAPPFPIRIIPLSFFSPTILFPPLVVGHSSFQVQAHLSLFWNHPWLAESPPTLPFYSIFNSWELTPLREPFYIIYYTPLSSILSIPRFISQHCQLCSVAQPGFFFSNLHCIILRVRHRALRTSVSRIRSSDAIRSPFVRDQEQKRCNSE